MKDRFLVIMAGGRGERFWPQSRLRRPKHLLPIVGKKPMLTQTVERADGVVPLNNIFIITNREQRDAVIEAVPGLPAENVVAEPVGRDTAAAVGLASTLVKMRNPDAVFGLLPADHVIHGEKEFRKILGKAFDAAEKDSVLVTIGIEPTAPATGYGYIQLAESDADETVFRVKRFVEKPDLETAKSYLESGDYFWNAGMFIWQVKAIEQAFADHAPEICSGISEIESGLVAGKSLNAVLEEVYPKIQRISIDYAVMEKAANVVMVKATFDWDDVGSWPAVARHFPADQAGNVTRGDVLLEGGTGNIVVSEGEHLIAAVGVDDLIIIHTKDATLICRKDQAEEIKKVVTKIGDEKKWQHLL
ncbi:MAG TPA: mannose-1-phosphate guanylyltransferase [Opitutales bacterium]|nr:mannose-1-phosphate guanylyltransferase [Opitutales bacterium]